MDLERQLSDHLATAARRATATPDLAEVELGARRIRGRRRVVTGVAAAMLVAAAGGAGFGLGRAAVDSDGQGAASATDPGSSEPAPTDTAVGSDTTDTTDTTGSTVGSDTTVAGTAASPSTEPGEPAPVPAPAPRLGAPGTMSADAAVAATQPAMPTYALVLERVTGSGITIRALRGESWESAEGPVPGGWAPAGWCYGDADLRIGLAGPGLIDVTGATWFSELHSAAAVTPSQVGWADAQPVAVLAVQVADGVTEVAASSGDVSDRVAPTAGLAVLVLPGVDPFNDGYAVEITDASGARVLTADELDPAGTPEWRAACEPPPPALPDAGEQPADPAAAEAAVREVFATLFDPAVPRDQKPGGLLDDETGVDAAVEQAREAFPEAVDSAVHTIEDFVFTSPTEAWFRYGIDTSGGYFGQRYGTAHLIDGAWRIARAVICQDLALAGATCEPAVEPIYPPSWYEMYGQPPLEEEAAARGEVID